MMIGSAHGRARRVGVVVALALCALVVSGIPGNATVSMKSSKTCKALDKLQRQTAELAGNEFDGSDLQELGDAFHQASKRVTKKLKPALKRLGKLYADLSDIESEAEVASRLRKLGAKDTAAFVKYTTYYETKCSSGSSRPSGGSGSAGGSIVLGDETIALASAQCYLQEQTAAGQTIELTAQGYGTDAEGRDVVIDFTRYAEDSDFAGDDFSVNIGAPGADDAIGFHGRLTRGAVERDGSTLRGSGFELRSDDGSSVPASFEINC